MTDPWKRKEEYKENRYPQQLEIQLNKTVDATDKEWDDWQEKELEDLLKIVRDAEKFKDLSKRLDEYEPQDEMNMYRDKGLG